MELPELYRHLVLAREYELAVAGLWARGLISGEMHVGTGEEAVAAGVVTHLDERDALALTHRSSPFLVVRGVPLEPMIKELLGQEDGLCGGRGGHMHLFCRKLRAATSGIVGASLPMGAGFALAAKRLRPGAVAMAQTGDGALNQGMALETLNLAAVWSLPLLVVCIDNGWAITTPAGSLTSGDLRERAAAFGWLVADVDGADVVAVHAAAGRLIQQVRRRQTPALLRATAPRLEGHYLGDELVRVARDPLGAGRQTMRKVVQRAVAAGGGGMVARAAGLATMMDVMRQARAAPQVDSRKDPLMIAQRLMKKLRLDCARVDAAARQQVLAAVERAMGGPNA